jgi:hypothetical protein
LVFFALYAAHHFRVASAIRFLAAGFRFRRFLTSC